MSERRPHPAPRRAAPRAQRLVRRQELDARRADRGRDPGPSRLRRVDVGVPHVRRGGGPRRDDRRRDGAHVAGRRRLRRRGVPRDQRGDALRTGAGRCSRRGGSPLRRAGGGGRIDEPPVAVRSSALGEDSQDATFAGQQETYLWVRGADHVCDAVRDCWVSLYSPPAIDVPRPARAGGRSEPAMGVAVQLMVDAEVSG